MARPLPRPVLCGVPHPPPRSPFRPVPLLAAPAAVGSRPVSFAQQAWPRAGRPSRCLKGGRRSGGGNPQGEGLRPLRQKGESPLHTQAPGLRGLAGAGRRCSQRAGGSPGPRPPLCRGLHVPRAHQRQASVRPCGLLKVLANDGMERDTCPCVLY